MIDDSDEQVWERARRHHPPAFGLIWDRHHARVFRHLVAAGQTAHEAEDLTATVFLELWRRRSAVRFVDGSVLPWLIVTARNVARNSARARRRYRRFLAALPAPEPSPDPAERIAEADDPRIAGLRRELSGLRPAESELLALTALEGFTVREAAAALGISTSAAKMRLSRLRSRLAIAIDPETVPEGRPR
ncbi:sigma-70 family RNA polymerase sigma factor [Leucobacter weissii]|uniref:Sigma-70 family RNA polymerase sigma factor n=1 Tax=Leucobacter weissii TaxID=1983706 RepID=A0A939MKS0_9MICO|nr:sigma-70 family RNA polymerase sigma factor [Leucobacter weissii]MBO1902573.1 sigma-70 family RNA polymerase sigma factor [Leucobacter weissii]